MMKICMRSLLVFFVVLVVAGCTNNVGRRCHAISDCLHARAARVERVGSRMYLLLPARSLFEKKSAQFVATRYNTMACIANWLHYHATSSIRITTYTNELPTSAANQKLSEERSESIKNYLWREQLGVSFIYAEGKGRPEKPDYFLGENYVEIVFDPV